MAQLNGAHTNWGVVKTKKEISPGLTPSHFPWIHLSIFTARIYSPCSNGLSTSRRSFHQLSCLQCQFKVSSLFSTVISSFPHSEKHVFLYGCGIWTTNLLVICRTLYPFHHLSYTQRSSEIVWHLYEHKDESHFDLAIFSDVQSEIDRESLSNQGLQHRQQRKTQSASHWPEEKVNCQANATVNGAGKWRR